MRSTSVTYEISGPFSGGFHISAYAYKAGAGRFVAYAKVFTHRPRDPWDGNGVAKFSTRGEWATAAAALRDAVGAAHAALLVHQRGVRSPKFRLRLA